MKYYLQVLKNYAVFTGRARRSEYWFFVLFNVIFAVVACFADRMLGLTYHMDVQGTYTAMPYGYIYSAYMLVVLIPGLAVAVRRLHDVGKSGWFLLVVLIPIIGAIWLLVLLFTDSEAAENKWGPNPKIESDELSLGIS
ncbi:DUF805 domain-containing protein [soil metagenome]